MTLRLAASPAPHDVQNATPAPTGDPHPVQNRAFLPPPCVATGWVPPADGVLRVAFSPCPGVAEPDAGRERLPIAASSSFMIFILELTKRQTQPAISMPKYR